MEPYLLMWTNCDKLVSPLCNIEIFSCHVTNIIPNMELYCG